MNPSPWTAEEIRLLSDKFQIHPGRRLLPGSEDFHFPAPSFVRPGYAPPGGYVKDFGLIAHDGRWHLFHIDGRPGEICWITGNEISFGHASSSDLRHWIRHRMPLAVGDRPWESEHIWAPFVHRRGEIFYLFYMGSGRGETFVSYATSRDLEEWTRWPRGPIRSAVGRDPFAFEHEGRCVLIYTGHGGARVAACASADMETWEPLPDLLDIPGGTAAESPSVHPCRGRHVLWFNDYGAHLTAFRAAYAFSDDPFHFEPADIREFDFQAGRLDVIASPELRVTKPTPLSIERLAGNDRTWLVAYFRWQGDRNRLFLGELDWDCEPAAIREFTDDAQLLERLAAYDLPFPVAAG